MGLGMKFIEELTVILLQSDRIRYLDLKKNLLAD